MDTIPGLHEVATTDISDELGSQVTVLEPGLRHFGGRRRLAAPIQTVRAIGDNSYVRTELQKPGEGRILVVDGGALRTCALLGDRLGDLAIENNWTGVVVNGGVRDTQQLAQLDLGVLALFSHPRRSEKQGFGSVGDEVFFLGARMQPGDILYADEDGVVIRPRQN